MAYEKNKKKLHYESDSDQEQYAKFAVLQSEKLPLTNLLLFIIEENISSLFYPPVSQKPNKWNNPHRGDKRQAEILLKLKKFYYIDINTNPYESLNTYTGAVHNKDLSLFLITEIKYTFKKKNIIDVERITIRKLNQIIDTNIYILTFYNPKTPGHK